MSSIPESVVLLEPAAQKLAELVESIEVDVKQMDTPHLQALLVGCSVVERLPEDEVHWAVSRVGPLVARVAQMEMDLRLAHARLRTAISL